MKPRVKQIDQQYDDGVLKVYSTEDISAPGEFENIQTVVKHSNVRYQNRTVGYNRFLQGRQVDLEIQRLLRIPKLPDIHIYDVVETEDKQQFRIEQIQYPQGVYPASADLSLSVVKQRIEVASDDQDNGIQLDVWTGTEEEFETISPQSGTIYFVKEADNDS